MWQIECIERRVLNVGGQLGRVAIHAGLTFGSERRTEDCVAAVRKLRRRVTVAKRHRDAISLDAGLLFQATGDFIDHRFANAQTVERDQHDRLRIVGSDSQRLRPNPLRNSLRFLATTAEAVETDRITGSNVDLRNADVILITTASRISGETAEDGNDDERQLQP